MALGVAVPEKVLVVGAGRLRHEVLLHQAPATGVAPAGRYGCAPGKRREEARRHRLLGVAIEASELQVRRLVRARWVVSVQASQLLAYGAISAARGQVMLQCTDCLFVQSPTYHAKAIAGESVAVECVACTLLRGAHDLWLRRTLCVCYQVMSSSARPDRSVRAGPAHTSSKLLYVSLNYSTCGPGRLLRAVPAFCVFGLLLKRRQTLNFTANDAFPTHHHHHGTRPSCTWSVKCV